MREKSFTTAAARRRKDPIVWHIDDTTVHLKATAELADIADALHEIQQPVPDGENQVKAAAAKRLLLVDAIAEFIIPEDVDAFKAIQADLDFNLLSEMLNEAVLEYTGQANPTSPSPSSTG